MNFNLQNQQPVSIAILGAGIGGFETFRTLARLLKRKGLPQKILLIDQNNYFTFTPLLHEVASGSVEPSHATVPLRSLTYKTPHSFLKAEVQHVDPEKKIITTSVGKISYDYCVVALGSGVNYYGTPGAAEYGYSVRSLSEAMRLRTDLIKKLEEPAPSFSVTIVGGGFTGVEVAGQLAYFLRHDGAKAFPHKTVSLNVVEAGSTLVPILPAKAQQKIIARLKKMGVELYFNNSVKEVKSDWLVLASGGEIQNNLTVWCAGVKNNGDQFLDPTETEKGKIPVNNYLQHQRYPSLYAVGDLVLGRNVNSVATYPPLGEAAHHQGEYVARHLVAELLATKSKKINSLPPFHFSSQGLLIPIGDHYGILARGSWVLSGFIAWWIRRTVYVFFMPGLARKIKIIGDWTLHLFGFSYIIAIEKNKN